MVIKYKLTSHKSTPESSIAPVNLLNCNGCHTGKSLFQSTRLVTVGQSASVGVPNILNILYNSSISESPGKIGLLEAISTIIVPTLHISTGNAYGT